MNLVKRYVSVLLVAVLTAALLMGCGGSAKKEEVKNASVSTAEKKPAEEVKEVKKEAASLKYDPSKQVNGGKEIKVTFWQLPQWQKFFEKLAADYNKVHPNVKFEFTWIGYTDLAKKLPVALQSGSGPDIFYTQSALEELLLSSMEPFPEDVIPREEFKKEFRLVDEFTNNGKVHYLNIGLMSSMIYYNTDMWKQAGLTDADIPKTWDQLIAVAKKLTKTNAKGEIEVAGFNFNSMEYLFTDLVYQQGKYLFAADKKTAVISSPEGVKATKLLHDMYNVHKIGDAKMPDAHTAFGNKQAAMFYSWGWVVNYLKNTFKDLKFSVFPLPTFDGKTPPALARNNGEGILAVNSKAKSAEKAAVFDFLKFTLNNDEWIAYFSVNDGITPAKYSVDSRPEIANDPIFNLMVKSSDRTIYPGPIPQVYMDVLVKKTLRGEILTNNKPIEESLKVAEKEINDNLKNMKFVSQEDKYKYASQMGYSR